jgi:hypothetical protein
MVMKKDRGEGVAELAGQIKADDLDSILPRLSRHNLHLGTVGNDHRVSVPTLGPNVMIAGSSGSGKTTLASAILEQLVAAAYQFCLLDPEGDYAGFEGPIEIGGVGRAPNPDEVIKVLQQPDRSVSVNLLGVPLQERPVFLARLIPMLQDLRERYGRPHQLVIDEAHHLLPKDSDLPSWKSVQGTIFITVEPDSVASGPLQSVDLLIATGETANRTIERFAHAVEVSIPGMDPTRPKEREVLVWARCSFSAPIAMQPRQGKKLSPRHGRKYAEAELPENRSFYFRGPDQKLNLRAQNLKLFVQLAKGIDDATWLHHLRRQDYSRWIKEALKDESLANEVNKIETECRDPAANSRVLISTANERRYTAPS